jgi:hypothetical protein
MARWASLAAVVIACGHAAPPPAPPPTHVAHADAAVDAPVPLEDDMVRLADRAVSLYQDIAKALGDTDCAAVTAKLDAIAVDYADVIAANMKVLHGDRDRKKRLRAALEAHEPEYGATAKAIADSPTMRSCSIDPNFARAIDRLGGES